MRSPKRSLVLAILLIFCFIINLYSRDEMRVENGYSRHFFPKFAAFLRFLLGKIPFSIGDILYGLLIAWLIWSIGRLVKLIFRKQPGISKKPHYAGFLYRLIVFCCSMYIVFNLFWGINYNRKGIAWQIGLKMDKYSRDDLKEINCVLIEKINSSKKELVESKKPYPTNRQLFGMIKTVYKDASAKYPFLDYEPSSIKSSMWGWLGNYTGFTGYYNPFTAEAQVNTTVPRFLHPFVACHEVAHQLGYAKEMEANFVGYLAAGNSKSPLFHYSVYLDLFIYANRNLYFSDSTAAKIYRKELDTTVIADLKQWAEFNRQHQNWAEPIVRWIYGKYLQGNRQPNGVLSYDEVTGFIIAYYKKFGKI